jgi:hypothetical protein
MALMLPIKSWRIDYADGSSFSSEQGTWAEAPPFGVQAVVYYHAEGLTVDGGEGNGDVYCYLGEGAYEGIKMGLWMDSEGYYRIADLARRFTEPEV